MRRAVLSLLLLVLLLAVGGAALPEQFPSNDGITRDDPVAWNQRLLENWKQNPEHYARLQRDLNRFWNLPRAERDRIRDLDRELHEQDSATQKRLWGVLERYHAWLEQLSESDRRKIEAVSGSERVALIRKMREQQWVDRLPTPDRTRLTELLRKDGAKAYGDEVARLRDAQRQRAVEVLRTNPTSKPRKDKPARLSEFPPEVQTFVRDCLIPLLNTSERESLRRAESAPWPACARVVADLAAKHPIPLPGPVGPVRISDLPQQLERQVRLSPRYQAIRKEEGHWPEFGVAVQSLPQYRRHPFATRLTPSSPADFSLEVQAFIQTLETSLSPEDADRLNGAKGKWPDYPKVLLELARKHKLTIPGMTLPGPKELWDNARAALPEVPDGTLFHFAMTELSREEREGLPLSSNDPAAREKVKKKFFEKHPRELKRLQQLDRHATTFGTD